MCANGDSSRASFAVLPSEKEPEGKCLQRGLFGRPTYLEPAIKAPFQPPAIRGWLCCQASELSLWSIFLSATAASLILCILHHYRFLCVCIATYTAPMEQQSRRIPSVHNQPSSVDFIQNRLSQTLDVIKGAPVYYSPQSGRFAALQTAAATMPPPSVGEKADSDQQEDDASTGRGKEMAKKRNVELPIRELVPAVEAMVFWSAILEPAMTQFVNANSPEPEKLVKKPQFSIRAQTEWRGIHENLQSAQDEFNGANKPLQSRFKRIYRKAADQTETLQDVVGKLPDDGTYMSLVKFVLDLLLGVR